MHQESSFKLRAISPKGARGLMQLMPGTAVRFGVTNIFDPQQNIEGGSRYLKFLLDRFDGDLSLTLAGYNAGEGAVDKYDGVPPYNETQNYVKIISQRYGKTYLTVQSPDTRVDTE
jgi:soluble lytic murein transglycosylase-like protein